MKKLFELILKEKNRLSTCKLNKVLNDDSIPNENKLNCIPAMTFFIMGFKDAMELVQYQNPDTDLKKTVNVHGDEDGFHWNWFLHDLEVLNQKIMKQKTTEVLADMFNDDFMPIRNNLYTTMRYVKQYKDPIFRIMIIEALETGYHYFSKDMTQVIINSNHYEDLHFFGKVHNDAEDDHDMESVIEEEEKLNVFTQSLTEQEKTELFEMTQDLFNNILAMHECFADVISAS